MTLVNIAVRNNSATIAGGGIWCYESSVRFDEEDRCNIYLNSAPTGSDISTYDSPVIHVVVDTFTVLNPTEYYASPLDRMTFDIRYAKLVPVYADLYVSPQGSNENSGLTANEPLKTINFALKKIRVDYLQSHTVFLAEGYYSPSTNGEIFPIPLKSYVSLIGSSENTTILDAEASAGVIHCAGAVEVNIGHITVQNGIERGISIINSDPGISNVTVQHNSAGSGGGILIHSYSNPTLMNVTVRDNLSHIEGQSGHSIGGGGVLIRAYSCPILNNLTVERNTALRGGGIRCDESSSPQIINSIVRDNYSVYHGGGLYWRSGAPILDNVTIVGNEAGSRGGGIYCDEATFGLTDVTINNNRAEKYGGGIYLSSSTGTMAGVTVSDNATQGSGGGIYASDSESEMAGVVITNNSAGNEISSYGGGIYSQNSNFTFDDYNRCNIYLNRASFGKDLYSDSPLAVVIDTFTVVKPTAYHIYPQNNFTCDILNGLLQQAEADLFVALDGNDDNSGLSIDAPLQTIDRALARIYADSLNPRSIYLADGIYSPSTNMENYPIYWISDISLSGFNLSETILDAAENDYALVCISINRVKIEKLSIVHAHLDGIYSLNSSPIIDQLILSENTGSGIRLENSSATISNATITNNSCGIYCEASNPAIMLSSIYENHGAGLKCIANASPLIQDVVIRRNAGSGIYCIDSNPTLNRVEIEANTSPSSGGGLYCSASMLTLADVRISKNNAENSGGGIFLTDSSGIIFSEDDLCNVVLNDATIGKDLNSQNNSPVAVIVDTFTVLKPTDYYVVPINQFTFNIKNYVVNQIEADLFVSPLGDNTNSGITASAALRTIDFALSKIAVDSLHTRTVYLAEGVYSTASNSERFPIPCLSYLSLQGSDEQNTILDAEDNSRVLDCYYSHNPTIHDLTIQNGTASQGAGIRVYFSNPRLTHVTIKNNTGVGVYCSNSDIHIIWGTLIGNNTTMYEYDIGGGIILNYSTSRFINVTICHNASYWWEGGGLYSFNSSSSIVNGILWGNTPQQIYFEPCWGSSSLIVTYSDVQDGKEEVGYSENDTVRWLEGNIDADPLFCYPDSGIYTLARNSPCLGTGQDGANMGAWGIGCEEIFLTDLGTMLLKEFTLYQNYPNPFNPVSTIQYDLPQASNVSLIVYDLLGREVARLVDGYMEPGNHQVQWNGKNSSGRELPSGIYIARLVTPEYAKSIKMVLLK
ncbi:MAG: DUF1565 domain-containing protein [Candidatus Marinimicrobia bacterium]|nr:DUF1565 domain-containing protein [Candidatus Neomarinimicrobiota bacterium]